MVKVTGPMQSFTASGKLANSIVFFGWKGIACVRQYVIPRNPQSADQGDIRLIIGGTGKACGKQVSSQPFGVKLTNLGVIPAQQTHQSYLVQYIKDNLLAGSGATMTGNYLTELAALTGHTAYTSWDAGADAIGLSDFDISYASIDPYEKALGLYLLARMAIDLNFTGAPYSIALASWTGAQIDQLVAHLEA